MKLFFEELGITPWEHQERGAELVVEAINAGIKNLCLTSPTGGGKTAVILALILWAKSIGWKTTLYTNRRLLLNQIQNDLAGAGIKHDIRAAGFQATDHWMVKLASMQTEFSRVYKLKSWGLSDAQLVIIDEAHVQRGDRAEQLINDHKAAGAAIVGITATPVDIGHLYSHLIVAGTNSELRKCGALVPAYTFAPNEPDCRNLKPTATGEFREGDVTKRIWTPTIIASVIEHLQRLNPDRGPTIAFLPSVATSLGMCEEFRKHGITAAHIDGQDVSYGEVDEAGDPVVYKSDREQRNQIIDAHRRGEVQVICNRFVLREGINLPWISHCILATMFGSLASYIQAGGRALRAHSGLEHVTIQDHGGNWHRLGSLNSDREWCLTTTDKQLVDMRASALRDKRELEPIRCPKCSKVRLSGSRCPDCGHVANKKSRMVVQLDGSLREVVGDIYKPRVVRMLSDTASKWERIYYRMKRSGKTFTQGEGLFYLENHYFPPRNLPLMPLREADFYLYVKDIPREKLRSKPEPQPEASAW